MGILTDHFTRIQQSLLAKAEEAGILRHPTSKGSARELLISEFLESALPREFDFVTGEIAATDGQRSGQLDIMLVPKSAPTFRLAPGISLGLVHAITAVIEVKSDLTTAPLDKPSELRNALETIRTVRQLPIQPALDPWPWSAGQSKSGRNVRLDGIPASIVALNGPTIETLYGHLTAWAALGMGNLPNTITCIARDYTLILNDGWIHIPELLPSESRQCLYIIGRTPCLVELFDFLMKVTQAWSYARPRTPLNDYL